MASASLLVSLPQMIDLAIGSPEIGAVNFNILCAALQVIIQQLNLAEHTVDYRGSDIDKMQALIATAKSGTQLKITEHEDEGRRTSELVGTVEPRRNSKEEPNAGSIGKNKIVIVEPRYDSKFTQLPQVLVGVSQELFRQINSDVEDLKSKMTEILELPNNETLIEAVRSHGEEKSTPVIDMWQALQIAKRLDAAETGMEKLAGLFEKLITDIGAQIGDEGAFTLFGDVKTRLKTLELKIGNFQGDVGVQKESDGETNDDTGGDIPTDVENLKNKVKALEDELAKMTKGIKGKNFADLFKDMDEIKTKLLGSDGQELDDGEKEGAELGEADAAQMDEKLAEFANKLNNLDENYAAHIMTINDQITNIEKELGTLLENQNTKGDTVGDSGNIGDLHAKIVKMMDDIDNLNKAIDKLSDENDEKSTMLETLHQQLELLKTTKADREDLEDALADKADNQQMNRKVSTVQFDAACEDLTRHIEDTMKKLLEQEEMWQNTLEELHLTIGAKLDKQEFDPLREFVNKKIKSLQQRLKALLAMKQEQEAAGTKSKILKNVNCISCDKDVIMHRDNKFPTLPTQTPLPGNRTIKPYITYELDAVRKQQKSLPQGRNLNYMESAVHDSKSKKEQKPAEKPLPPGHICNRYCGGSHTMTQPQQRVAHIGHFLSQWGPQAIPQDEGQIMGTDGQMYKAREGGGDVRGPIVDDRRSSAQVQTEEPRENVPRMSATLEAIKKPRSSKTKSGSKQALDGDQLEPVKEETEVESTASKAKTGSRHSLKSARKSAQKLAGEGSKKGSSSTLKDSQVQKKSSTSIKQEEKTGTPSEIEEADVSVSEATDIVDVEAVVDEEVAAAE